MNWPASPRCYLELVRHSRLDTLSAISGQCDTQQGLVICIPETERSCIIETLLEHISMHFGKRRRRYEWLAFVRSFTPVT